jgi:hypothetical protein
MKNKGIKLILIIFLQKSLGNEEKENLLKRELSLENK